MKPETRLKRAAAKSAAARVEFEAAIAEARDSGLSLSEIAKLSGLSIEGARKIIIKGRA